jgi:YgiT-type zinc finger domain-containing protein
MKCALCNNKVVKIKGSVEFEVRSLGKISVPNLEYFECSACGDQLLTSEQSKKAFKYIANEEQDLINKLPIGQFITANEAAGLLGVTKQAFSKHPKIRSGMIFSALIGDRKYYHKKSIELFKETDNGKFLLVQPDAKVEPISLDDLVGSEVGYIYYTKIPAAEEITVCEKISVDKPVKTYSDLWQAGFNTNATSSDYQPFFMGEGFPPKKAIGENLLWP